MRDDVMLQHAELHPAFEGFLAELSAALAVVEVDDLERKIARWLDRLARDLGAERCSVCEFYDAEELPRFLLRWKAGQKPEPFMPEARTWIQGQLSSGRVLAYASLDEMPVESEAARRELKEMGVRSGLWVPMLVEGSAVGAIGLTVLSREQAWPAHIIQRCRLVADAFGNALLRRRRAKEIEDLAKFETLVTDISARLMDAEGNIDALIVQVLKELGELLEAHRVTFLEIDGDEQSLVVTRQWVKTGIPYEADQNGLKIVPYTNVAPRFRWLAAKMFAGEPVAIDNLDQFPEEAENERAYCESLGIQSFTMVPATHRGSVVAALALDNFRVHREWNERLLQRLQIVASMIAGGQVRARAQREVEERERFEALVTEISAKFSNVGEDFLSLTDQALGALGEFLGTERIGLVEVDPDTHRLIRARQWTTSGIEHSYTKVQHFDVSAGLPWLTAQILAGDVVAIRRVDQLPEEAVNERRHCERLGIKSFAIVPAAVNGTIAGALAFDSYSQNWTWDDRLLSRVRIVAELIAAAQTRTRAQREIDELRHFENAISRISTAFVNLAPEAVNEKIEAGLKVVAAALDVDLITLLQPQGQDGYLVTHEWAADELPGEGFKGVIVGAEFPWLAGRLSGVETVSISALSELPAEAANERAAMEREGLQSVLWVPFRIRGELAGHLAINTIRQRAWSEALYPQLRLLGEVFGEALNRRDAELKLQQSFAKIEALKDELQLENLYLREETKLTQRYGDIIGDSACLRAALVKAEQVAPTDSTVLLLGETGTGKELLARVIHNNSPRDDQVMVKVNCAALPSSLVEAELFGREKGAYTGALTRVLGRFEIADGSTILLDEIGELSPELQAKLLRVLQDGEFERLGSSKTVKVDVRVLAATNRDLAEAVKSKEFREDLYYRLNVFPVELPPLRDRVDDIPQLVWAFVQEFAQTMGKTIETIPRTVMDALKAYSWPGNVREVRNLVERAMIVSQGPGLEIELPAEATPSGSAASSRRLADVERDHIRAVLESTAWRIRGAGGAAQILGLKPTTLEARMKKLGLERSTTH